MGNFGYDLHLDEPTNTVFVETTKLPKRWTATGIKDVRAEVAATYTGVTWVPVVTPVEGGETLCFVPSTAKRGRPSKDTVWYRRKIDPAWFTSMDEHLAKLRGEKNGN